TPQPPPETVTQAAVTVNQHFETVKPITIPSTELTKVPSNSVINMTEMTLLKANHSEYIDVQTFFRTGLPNNIILGIFKLNMPTHLVKAHEDYRAKNLNMKNVRVFHGTKHVCNPKRFISDPKAEFCRSGCGVCGIAQNGNKITFARDKRLWFANNSSVSLGYCNNGYQKPSGYRKKGATNGTVENAMFVVELITQLIGPVFTLDSEAVCIQ
ncbi:13361_t:CDS:2, partial [Gigaspora margarita]